MNHPRQRSDINNYENHTRSEAELLAGLLEHSAKESFLELSNKKGIG